MRYDEGQGRVVDALLMLWMIQGPLVFSFFVYTLIKRDQTQTLPNASQKNVQPKALQE
jgi:hypothetical protein